MKRSELTALLMDAPATLPTIGEIADNNLANGGYFFSRSTNKWFRDCRSNWRPKRGTDGKLYIQRNGARDSSSSGRQSAFQVRAVTAGWGISPPLDDVKFASAKRITAH